MDSRVRIGGASAGCGFGIVNISMLAVSLRALKMCKVVFVVIGLDADFVQSMVADDDRW